MPEGQVIKLVNATSLDDGLTSIADAIREKGGTSADLAFPTGFVSAINAIPTGGSGLNWDDIVTKNVTGIITITALRIRDYSFYAQPITKVVAPNVIQFDQSSFAYCRKLGTCIFPEVTTFSGGSTFANAGGTSMATTNCILVFPKLALGNVRSTFDRGNFAAIDIGQNTSNLYNDTFYHNTGNQTVGTLILRKKDSIVTASTSGAISGLRDVYVPQTLISSYTSATNWSSRINGGYITLHAIEGSQYENYYADGTPIT